MPIPIFGIGAASLGGAAGAGAAGAAASSVGGLVKVGAAGAVGKGAATKAAGAVGKGAATKAAGAVGKGAASKASKYASMAGGSGGIAPSDTSHGTFRIGRQTVSGSAKDLKKGNLDKLLGLAKDLNYEAYENHPGHSIATWDSIKHTQSLRHEQEMFLLQHGLVRDRNSPDGYRCVPLNWMSQKPAPAKKEKRSLGQRLLYIFGF